MNDPTALSEQRCRHCNEQIRLCDCGARGTWRDESRHWADRRFNSRWCKSPINKLHEPEETP